MGSISSATTNARRISIGKRVTLQLSYRTFGFSILTVLMLLVSCHLHLNVDAMHSSTTKRTFGRKQFRPPDLTVG